MLLVRNMRGLIFILVFLVSISLVKGEIRINEIMVNPDYDEDLNEWVEIYNDGSDSINVKDYRIEDKLIKGGKENGSGAIIPSKYFGIITDSETRVYDNFCFGNNIVRLYLDGNLVLSNNGGEIVLYDDGNDEIDNVDYPKIEDGYDYSLINDNWVKTKEISPGRDNENNESFVYNYSVVKINEFLPDPKGEDNALIPKGEWVELYNGAEIDLDLLGFSLYDHSGKKIVITDVSTEENTIIKGKGYLVVYINGLSGFLNNEGLEKIKLNGLNDELIDEVIYSGSSEDVSWSKTGKVWKKTVPSPGKENIEANIDESFLKIEKIYDLGNDKKAEWGDLIRVKLLIYKGDTTKNSVSMWVEKDGKRVSKETKTNVYSKFQNYSLTLPIQLVENCDSKFEDSVYKIIVSGLDIKKGKNIEIKEKPLCENNKDLEKIPYEILEIPANVKVGEGFITKIKISNNFEEDKRFDVWSYVYSGSHCLSGERKENLQKIKVESNDYSEVELKNIIVKDVDGYYKLKVKIKREDRKTEDEITEDLMIVGEKNFNFGLENPLKSETVIYGLDKLIYESNQAVSKRSGIFFMVGVLILLVNYYVWKK